MYRILQKVYLNALRGNARLIKEFSNKKLIAVVKDDAYGHGAAAVCHALEGIADLFAVASVEEGAALRTAGIVKDILVLTPCLCVEEGVRLISYGLIASVSSLASLRVLFRAERYMRTSARVHLSVNTGMNRYGVRPERVGRFLTLLSGRAEGVYSHLYDPSDKDALSSQAQIFSAVREEARRFSPEILCHLSATGGALAGAESDAVRAGLALYGYLPAGFEGRLPVQPVSKFYATVTHSCKQLGNGAGYNRPKERYDVLHTLRVGYADGPFRSGGDRFIGKLCMDAGIGAGRAKFAARRSIFQDIAQYAKECGTSEYEILVRLGQRSEKQYLE